MYNENILKIQKNDDKYIFFIYISNIIQKIMKNRKTIEELNKE